MARLATDLDIKRIIPVLVKQLFLWGPIVVGLVHQFLMYFFGIDNIYVFVDPPKNIYPFVSLEFQWWFVLLVGSAVVAILAYSDRLQNIPTRLALPFYIYILFLLILVKPV